MKVKDLLHVIPNHQDFEICSKTGTLIKDYSWFYSNSDVYKWIIDNLGDKLVYNVTTTYDEDILIIRIK